MKRPNPQEKYVEADGRLTLDGLKLIELMQARIEELEKRIEALEP